MSDFLPEIRKAIPIIVRPSDREHDPRLDRMFHILDVLKKTTAQFHFECVKEECPNHCCKPCSAWTFHAEVIREEHLKMINDAYSGDPLNAFYNPETGCMLPWEARPVNCLVFMCGREHAIERAVFTETIVNPMKTIRRMIWDYAYAPNKEVRDGIWEKVRGMFAERPQIWKENMERLTLAVGSIDGGIRQER